MRVSLVVPWVLEPPFALKMFFASVVDLSTCSFVVPSFARESAASLPGTLQWEGIYCRVTVWFVQLVGCLLA